MILSKEVRDEFEKAAKPLMEFLSNPKLFHPHVKVIVDSCRAELVEGVCTCNTGYSDKDHYYRCKCGHEEQVGSGVEIYLHSCSKCDRVGNWEQLPF